MSDDYYRRIDGIREPDPTLGQQPQSGYAAEHDALAELAAEQEQVHHTQPKIRRQRVVLAQPSRSPGSLRARVELEEQTSWGEALIQDLIKAQLRSAVLLALLVVVPCVGLPLAFHFFPGFADLRVVGLPVSWLLLAVVPFPLMFAVGLWYNRLAERHERDFVDIIEN